VLTFAEIQAIAAGNPDIKERIDTTNKLAELNMLKREWNYEKAKMRECLEDSPARLAVVWLSIKNLRMLSLRASLICRDPL
jgi:hypothetical protein